MDYKATLNLPRTQFPMKADLVKREPERLAKWEATKLYERIQAQRQGAEKFVLHDGPPFANGDVHIGTALNKILKDFIVKYKTLRGYNAPYVPGWDCHGLPIEFKVSQELRRNREAATGSVDPSAAAAAPAALRTACEAYARKYVEIQRVQFQRLGVLGDWENPYLTLHKAYEAEELRLFADIVDQGLVYRGKKPVYWCIPCRTALAEAEVEYREHVSQSIFVKFPVVGRPKTFVLIWTTTPWTLPANLAVAYNSTFSYVQVRLGGECYLLHRGLLPSVAAKCGWGPYEEGPIHPEELVRLEYQHPFCSRTGRLVAGDHFVTGDTGTGFVHIAPGHGLEDYGLGLEHGLPTYSPVDDEGRFAYTEDLPVAQQMPKELIGQSILETHGKSDANQAVLHALRVRQALLHQENYHHSYPHCWRSKTPVIFRAMDQWFIGLDRPVAGPGRQLRPVTVTAGSSQSAPTFRQAALAAIQSVRWVPDWGANRIKAAVQSRPDWCISRQRAWGVPLPAFYDATGGALLEAQIVRNTADLIEQQGSNVWFEASAAELWSRVRPKNWPGPEAVAKSNDTLDVWIDSGSSSRAVVARRQEFHSQPPRRAPRPPFEADLYLEGSDQHRGWFQSSLLLSLAGNGAAPFQTVLTHGFMVDADREKISKSKQHPSGYEKPQTAEAYVKKWGADIIRLWVSSQDYRNDIIVSEERIGKVAETYRVIRNALRYQLSNLYDFDPVRHTVADDRLTGLDRWVLSAFSKLEEEVLHAYDAYEFHAVYQKISQFTAVELSAIYHDVIKDRLYTDPANSPRRRSTQTALHRLVTGLCRMLAPILAFTADEAWECVPGKAEESVHRADWQPTTFAVSEGEQAAWKHLLAWREFVLPKLEEARQKKEIGKALEAKLLMSGRGENALFWNTEPESLRELLNVSQFSSPAESTDVPVQEMDSRVGALPNPCFKETMVEVRKADGQKCERCWHWETDVGSHPEHPTLCGRCVEAVNQFELNHPARA